MHYLQGVWSTGLTANSQCVAAAGWRADAGSLLLSHLADLSNLLVQGVELLLQLVQMVAGCKDNGAFSRV
jgi:hypothetical protein